MVWQRGPGLGGQARRGGTVGVIRSFRLRAGGTSWLAAFPTVTRPRRNAPESSNSMARRLAVTQDEAAVAVSEDLLRAISLIGLAGHLRERVATLAEAGVSTRKATSLAGQRDEGMTLVAQLRALIV